MTIRRLSMVGALFAGALFVTALSGCAQTKAAFGEGGREVAMTATPLNPSATGEIEVTREDQNLKLDIDARHLPRPQDLAPELSSYVVWLRPTGSEKWFNVGAMRLDEDRDASLEVRTAYRDVEVAITAERTPTAERPSRYQVLEGQVLGAV